MSEFRFRMPSAWKLSSYHASSIFVVGLDGIPWPCKVEVDTKSELAADGPILQVVRNQEESGRVYLIYPLRERKEMLLCTGTLPVRDVTYDLVKEIARGTLNRLRNQIFDLAGGGPGNRGFDSRNRYPIDPVTGQGDHDFRAWPAGPIGR